MLDYPDKLSAIIWFPNCNLRCQYCYNSDMIDADGTISELEVLNFLKERKNKLDAVVLSGGEATLFSNLISFCEKIKDLGYFIKLDTNATNIKPLKELIENKLIDSIAVDYKAPNYKLEKITQVNYWEIFSDCLNFLINNLNSNLEIRTTIHTALLNEDDIISIIDDLINRKYIGNYYLQNFLKNSKTLNNLNDQKNMINYEKIKKYIQLKTCDISLKLRNF